MMEDDAWINWTDLFGLLFLILLVLIAPPVKHKPSIPTPGQFAIIMTWDKHIDTDMDLYVQDPPGHVAWFGNPSAGLMHLEHDDLGRVGDTVDGVTIEANEERVILRGVIPGEYVVNISAYRKSDHRAVPVTVQLVQLAGLDEVKLDRTTTIHLRGEEHTVFRFTLDAQNNVSKVNDLQKSFVDNVQVRSLGHGSMPSSTP